MSCGRHCRLPWSGRVCSSRKESKGIHHLLRRVTAALLAASALIASAAHASLNIVIVRHGQTDWNRAGCIQGGNHNPLNATGREQAAAMVRALAELRIDGVYTSSHLRARQTVAVLEGRAPIAAMDELRERIFGRFEGANDKDRALLADWNKRRFTWDDAMEGGETLESQSRRAALALALDKIRDRHMDGGTIVIVGHGGIYAPASNSGEFLTRGGLRRRWCFTAGLQPGHAPRLRGRDRRSTRLRSIGRRLPPGLVRRPR
ncbi:MAG: histidine phosphatase family protein [Rubrivivax sp.]|nr:histidine phosphatase family protein [Rubrivivax sp.]